MKPTHPDMTLLEQVIQGQDAAAESRQALSDMQPLNEDCLMYVAGERAMRAQRLLRQHDLETVIAGAWLDGFCAGASAQRRKGEK